MAPAARGALMARLAPAVLACALAACGPSLATRYAAGNAALSTSDGAVYLVVIAPVLQRALNDCIPTGLPGASPVLVLVADIDVAGRAHGVDVEPDSPGTACVRDALAGAQLARPPLGPGAATFPIGLRIDTR